eukprot:95741_1
MSFFSKQAFEEDDDSDVDYNNDNDGLEWDLSLNIMNNMNVFTETHANEPETEQEPVVDDNKTHNQEAESSNQYADDNMEHIIRTVNDSKYQVNLNREKFKHELNGNITYPHLQLKLGAHYQKELWVSPPIINSTEPAPAPFKANKTYINGQRDQFICDVLTTLFYINISSIKSYSRTKKIILLFNLLWFRVNTLTEKDFHLIEKEINKVVTELKKMKNIDTNFISYLLNDDKVNKCNTFYLTIDKIADSQFFKNTLNSLWQFMCEKLITLRDLSKFEKMFQDVVMNWNDKTKLNALKGWSVCSDWIFNLLCSLSSFILCKPRTLISTMLFKIKEVFIFETRTIVIRNMHPLKQSD